MRRKRSRLAGVGNAGRLVPGRVVRITRCSSRCRRENPRLADRCWFLGPMKRRLAVGTELPRSWDAVGLVLARRAGASRLLGG